MTRLAAASPLLRDARRNAVAGTAVIATLLLALVLAASFVRLDSAVVAGGSIAVVDGAQQIAHPVGGVVSAISVRSGDRVKMSDPLFELDSTGADLAIESLRQQLFGAWATIARLDAESAGTWTFESPPEAADEIGVEFVNAVMLQERSLMHSRQQLVVGAQAQIDIETAQTEAEQAREAAARTELRSDRTAISSDLDALRSVPADITTPSRISSLDEQALVLDREIAALDSSIEQFDYSADRMASERDDIDVQAKTQAMLEATEARQRHSQLEGELDIALLEKDRLIVRAPTDGVVQESAVVTKGGVVAAGVTVLTIVPENATTRVEARIAPTDIASVHPGDKSRLVIAALDRLDAPEVLGRVLTVSPTTVVDPDTGDQYYRAVIAVDETELSKLPANASLTPGMAVDVYVSTGARSILSYLLSPLTDRLREAMREE